MGLSCPQTLQKCFRILDPPSLHPPPPSLGIHGLCTSWPLSPDNFTHLGLGLDNFPGICFLPCPRLPLAAIVQLSGMGAPGQWGHRALTDVVEASRGQALRQTQGGLASPKDWTRPEGPSAGASEGPLRPLRRFQETRVASREESGVLGFPSRRGLTPRGSLEGNPEIPAFPGEEY